MYNIYIYIIAYPQQHIYPNRNIHAPKQPYISTEYISKQPCIHRIYIQTAMYNKSAKYIYPTAASINICKYNR